MKNVNYCRINPFVSKLELVVINDIKSTAKIFLKFIA